MITIFLHLVMEIEVNWAIKKNVEKYLVKLPKYYLEFHACKQFCEISQKSIIWTK